LQFRRYLRLQYLKILRLKDSPHKIAGGMALGLGLDFLPLPIISLPVAWVLARILRLNSIAAVMTVAFFKWAVFTIFFPFDILVGKLFLGKPPSMAGEQVPVAEPGLSLEALANFFTMETLYKLGAPFLLGSVINAVFFGLLAYFLLHRALVYRKQKRQRKIQNPDPKA